MPFQWRLKAKERTWCVEIGTQSPKQYGIFWLSEHVDRGFDNESDLLVGFTLNIPLF